MLVWTAGRRFRRMPNPPIPSKKSTMRRLPLDMALGLAAGAALGAEFEVRQADRLFAPARVTVGKGSVVHFANDENFVHHAFVDTPQF
jgi:plastocyanin